MPRASAIVLAAGTCAALHVAKLPPAVAALRSEFGLTLVQAGFLLSLVQLAGMSAAIAFGIAADRLGARRSIVLGLTLLAAASAAGAAAPSAGVLLALRAVEGIGFLMVVVPAPGLLRRLAPAPRVPALLGLWGAYMPFGTALALLAGGAWVAQWGWRSGWAVLALLTFTMAALTLRGVPAAPPPSVAAAASDGEGWLLRLRTTLGTAGPWWVALTFAAYSSQWLAVIGFLPTIYQAQGLSGAVGGALTALVAGCNMIGNIGGGRLLQRGVPAPRLLRIGFAAMALTALATFGEVGGAAVPPVARYLALLAFSAFGGLVPVALFSLALRVAPGERTVATTVGWMQQWSAFGQFAGPPLVGWVAGLAGGWQLTGLVTATLAGIGLLLVLPIAALTRATALTPRR